MSSLLFTLSGEGGGGLGRSVKKREMVRGREMGGTVLKIGGEGGRERTDPDTHLAEVVSKR